MSDNLLEVFGAACDGHDSVIEAYLKNGGGINVTHPITGHTLLYNACVFDRLHTMECLLKSGADPNQRISYKSAIDGTSRTNIVVLMFVKSADAVRLLIKYGADPNSCDENGVTVLGRAVLSAKIEVVRALLENKANVSSLSNQGRNAIDIAKQRIAEYKRLSESSNASRVNVSIQNMERIASLLAEAEQNIRNPYNP